MRITMKLKLKHKIKMITLLTGLACTFTMPVMATASINEMQSCQGLLDFLDSQLDVSSSKYSSTDIDVIRKGLKLYNQHIQEKIVTPGLIKFSTGDKAQAKALQEQVDAYKLTLVNSFKARYPEPRLYMDQAVALNNCTQKAVPADEALDDLKAAMNMIVKLAKMN